MGQYGSIKCSGKRRAKVWLEYLLWLAYLNEGSAGTERRRIVVLVTKLSSVKVLVRSKLGSIYNRGLKIWRYAQQQPLVLPAALLLKPLEKAKAYQWETTNPTEK